MFSLGKKKKDKDINFHNLLDPMQKRFEERSLNTKSTRKIQSVHLTDFGVSRQFDEENESLMASTATGTPSWMAPEVLALWLGQVPKETKYDPMRADSMLFSFNNIFKTKIL